MNWKASVALVGSAIKYLGLILLVPFAVALWYGEDAVVFLISVVIVTSIGLALERLEDDPDLGPREALLMVAMAWLCAGILGAIPYLLASAGTASSLADPFNAVFESMSGFTTTGATVMESIGIEHHSHALLLWRQLTQWLGGMGIIVLMIAILPELAINGAQLMQSEAPGPDLQKLTPRIAETARALWFIYLGFTVLLIALLYGAHLLELAPNMNFFNAVSHGFTTLPTGGFSPQADSIAAFSGVVQWIIIPFIVVAGVNFALFWHVLDGSPRTLLDNIEFRTYAGAIAVLAAVLTVVLVGGAAPVLERGGNTASLSENTIRQAVFQITSLLNSTGYATADFAQWDGHARLILLFAMFIGGSAGSTGGGIKVIRWIVTVKAIRREVFTVAHPRDVRPIRLAGRVIDEPAVRAILAFTALYLVTLVVSTVIIGLDSARIGYDISPFETLSASLATIGNIGPGFGEVGPFGNYADFSPISKSVMIIQMWIGRLEIVPVLALIVSWLDK